MSKKLQEILYNYVNRERYFLSVKRHLIKT